MIFFDDDLETLEPGIEEVATEYDLAAKQQLHNH